MKKFLMGLLILVIVLSGCTKPSNPMENGGNPNIGDLMKTWDNQTIYASGLIESERETLQLLQGTSVYHIDLTIADDLTHLTGTETVRYTNRESEALSIIAFQLYPNQLGGKIEISDPRINGKPADVTYLESNSAVAVSLPAPLQPGESALIEMTFSIDLPGVGGGNYGLFGFIDNILVLDGFYPGIPVYDDLGWHAGPLTPNADTTFNDVSYYLVRVTAPVDLVIIGSGVEVDRKIDKKQQMVTFAAGPARDFYLAASADFEKVTRIIGETTVNSYALPGFKQGADLALNTAVEALKDFNERYGPYPYTEFDVVSTPMQGATGIEYPGIIGINKLIYDPNQTIGGTSAFVMLESTVAHEVGHQWFYGTVGNDQAKEPWIDESLTQYVTSMYFLDEYGETGRESYRESWMARWERVNLEALPIGLPADAYVGPEYSAIVYGRGPVFVQTLAETMGQSNFDAFLLDYAQRYQWHISGLEEFKTLAESHCNCDLTNLFVEWVYPARR